MFNQHQSLLCAFSATACCSLSPLDAEAMQRLQTVVNIVPVIAKADTFTPEELLHFKQRVGCLLQSPVSNLGVKLQHTPLPGLCSACCPLAAG